MESGKTRKFWRDVLNISLLLLKARLLKNIAGNAEGKFLRELYQYEEIREELITNICETQNSVITRTSDCSVVGSALYSETFENLNFCFGNKP